MKKSDVNVDQREVKEKLVPVLKDWEKIELKQFTQDLLESCTKLLEILLPLRDDEMEFIGLLRDEGKILPELITADNVGLQDKISKHPAIRWRAHRGGESSLRLQEKQKEK